MNIMNEYIEKLIEQLENPDLSQLVLNLAESMREVWGNGNSFFLCGNGGSAGNAIHLANDFLYGINKHTGKGMKVEALSANPSVLTCLANDIGYENIYSYQLHVKASKNDILLVLSGSGNSENVVNAIKTGNKIGMKTFAILGYTGGDCKKLAQHPIHIPVNDMQIAEDLQLIVGHMCMQWLLNNPAEIKK